MPDNQVAHPDLSFRTMIKLVQAQKNMKDDISGTHTLKISINIRQHICNEKLTANPLLPMTQYIPLISCFVLFSMQSCSKEDFNGSSTDYLIFGHFYGECVGDKCGMKTKSVTILNEFLVKVYTTMRK